MGNDHRASPELKAQMEARAKDFFDTMLAEGMRVATFAATPEIEARVSAAERNRDRERERVRGLAVEMHGFCKKRGQTMEAHAYHRMIELIDSGKTAREAFGGDFEGHGDPAP